MTRPRIILDRVIFTNDGSKGDITVSNSNTVWNISESIDKDWAGTHSWLDNKWSLKDNSDDTKVLNFQLSGVTTGTTRTLTVPDADGTIALTTDITGTDLTYTASSRVLASSTGSDVTLPLFTSTEAGLTPLSGGGTSNFLRADGTWAAPSGSGITNSADNNELMKSDGTNAVASGLFSSVAGTYETASGVALILGSTGTANTTLQSGSGGSVSITGFAPFGGVGTGFSQASYNGSGFTNSANHFRISNQTTGTGTLGVGVGIMFHVRTGVTNLEEGAFIEAVTTDVTAGNEDFDLVFKTMAGGTTASEKLRITSTGVVKAQSDVAVLDSSKGLILKDTQGTPHYWRVTIDNSGVLTTTDLGTSI